jgi:hypothetical protein
MKKIFLSVSFLFTSVILAHAQIVPSFQFGIKAGANLTNLSSEGLFESENQAGYLAGFWGRLGAGGIHLQPEVYFTGKQTLLKNESTGDVNKVKFTSVDVPILLGTKFGVAGIGGRLNTGPVVSLVINQDQSFEEAASNALALRYKNQAMAWQLGAGVDIRKISIDLRYELGITKLNQEGYEDIKLRMFNLSLAYRIF